MQYVQIIEIIHEHKKKTKAEEMERVEVDSN